MFKSIKKLIKLIFDTNQFSISSVVIFSIISFYIWMTVNALFIFQQFSFYKIIFVSFIFFTLFAILTSVLLGDFFKEKIKVNIYNGLLSCIMIVFMVLVADTFYMDIELKNTIIIKWYDYYHVFPLFETEIGLGWNQDTVFHSSIIQSILNFGYPSIGQHGSPFIAYHVLSHYMDALILLVSNVEVYESYGLFVHFKIFLFISTIVVFLAYVFRNTIGYIFLIILLLVVPIMIGTWHGIGSHGLWFTTILLILSSPKVFNIIIKDESNSIKDFIFLFLLIVIISFGKISTGFAYATFLGIYLWLKQPKNKLVYFLGIAWIGFFLIYKNLMIRNVKETSGLDFSWLNVNAIYGYITDSSHLHYKIQISIFATIFILIVLSFIFRNKRNTLFLIATLSSYLILLFITRINTGFSISDISYFYYGLSSVLILFSLQLVSLNIENYKEHFFKLTAIDNRLIAISILLSALCLTMFYSQPKIKAFEIKPRTQIDAKFKKVNKLLEKSDQFSYKNRLKEPLKRHLPKEVNRSLSSFRKELNIFMADNGISKQQAVLYISKEIFTKDITKFKGPSWARGMLIYAITGVPLVNGISKLRKDYGYIEYAQDSLWIHKRQFQPDKACALVSSKYIIITNDFFEPSFDLYQCSVK